MQIFNVSSLEFSAVRIRVFFFKNRQSQEDQFHIRFPFLSIFEYDNIADLLLCDMGKKDRICSTEIVLRYTLRERILLT